jgi:3-dehydroquinate synthase II
MLITASVNGRVLTTLVQNAETIRLTRPDGAPVSVVHLAPGDRVLIAIEQGGRHFGYAIQESITEK